MTSQTEVKSRTMEIVTDALETFCNDISGMFGVEVKSGLKQVATESVSGIAKHFKSLVAVNLVKAEGTLEGTFPLVFDREGLFALAGVILMLSEQQILENIEGGSLKEAEGLGDGITEAGNLLVGSWDRTFGTRLEGHGRLTQAGIFIGNPWLNSEEIIGLAGHEECAFVSYEMTIGPYPSFNCGVVFAKTIFGDLGEAEAEEEKAKAPAENEAEAQEKTNVENEDKPEAAVEEKAEADAEPEAQVKVTEKNGEKAEDAEPIAEKTDSKESDRAKESDVEVSKPQEPAPEKVPSLETSTHKDTDQTSHPQEASATRDEAASANKPEPGQTEPAAEDVSAGKVGTSNQKPQVPAGEETSDADTTAAESIADEKSATPAKIEEGPVSEAIRKMVQSPEDGQAEPASQAAAATPAAGAACLPEAMCAKDIMQKDTVWGTPDDTVNQALEKMQQYDAGYMMIGRDGAPEGIVSKSDIAGAISPYLRPVFSKWRRTLDDATLQIKVKWIMSRPVQTVRPQTSLGAIMENMCSSGRRAFPVTDAEGKVQGLVTVFDIFKALLNSGPNVFSAGKTPEAPPLA